MSGQAVRPPLVLWPCVFVIHGEAIARIALLSQPASISDTEELVHHASHVQAAGCVGSLFLGTFMVAV